MNYCSSPVVHSSSLQNVCRWATASPGNMCGSCSSRSYGPFWAKWASSFGSTILENLKNDSCEMEDFVKTHLCKLQSAWDTLVARTTGFEGNKIWHHATKSDSCRTQGGYTYTVYSLKVLQEVSRDPAQAWCLGSCDSLDAHICSSPGKTWWADELSSSEFKLWKHVQIDELSLIAQNQGKHAPLM